jgi:hypothetical protein
MTMIDAIFLVVPLLVLSSCPHLASTILRVGALPTVIKELD